MYFATAALYTVGVAHIRDVNFHPVFDTFDVEQVAAVFRDQAVQKSHSGSQIYQPPGQIGAYEAQPPGDEDFRVSKFKKAIHTHIFRAKMMLSI
jgi:hypothetical protein